MAGSTDYTTDRVLGSTGNTYNAVFTTKTDNSELSANDFLQLLITQMQNQDFTDPMDNSTMVTEMAQFSNMKMMQNMASSMQSTYALNLVGKTVSAAKYDVSGNVVSATGTVDKVIFDEDDGPLFYINGTGYTLSQITSVQSASGSSSDNTDDSDTESSVNPLLYQMAASQITSSSAHLAWQVPTDSSDTAENLTYTVYVSKTGPMTTVAETKANGLIYGSAQQKNLTETEITGLLANTQYVLNVLVRDANGVESVYQPATITTAAQS